MTAATSAVDGTLDALLTSPSFFDDPYPTYTRLRDEAPVHWCEPWGAWVLTRHDIVSSVVKDQKRFASGGYELRVAESLERQFGVELPSLRAHYAMKIVTIAGAAPENRRRAQPPPPIELGEAHEGKTRRLLDEAAGPRLTGSAALDEDVGGHRA